MIMAGPGVPASHRVGESKGLDISGESFSKISNRLFFSIALSVSRNVGHAGSKSALLGIGMISTVRPLIKLL